VLFAGFLDFSNPGRELVDVFDVCSGSPSRNSYTTGIHNAMQNPKKTGISV
jgi:hypothetical protein